MAKNIFLKYRLISNFFTASLMLCIFYRALFFIQSYPIAIEPAAYRFVLLSLGLVNDFIVCSTLTAILFVIRFALSDIVESKNTAGEIIFFSYEAFVFLIFLTITIVYLINLKIFTSLFIGLNYTILLSYLSLGPALINHIQFIDMADLMRLTFMIGVYIAIKLIAPQRIHQFMIYILFPIYFILSLYGSVVFLNLNVTRPGSRTIAIYASPISEITTTFLKSFNDYNKQQIAISDSQRHSVKLIDESFLSSQANRETSWRSFASLGVTPRKWNIVIFVLESVGSSYPFDTINSKIPMPFLKELSQKSLWFSNNYTSGNISALGQFSIFTGIYPNPIPSHFEMQENVFIPTIASWLKNSHDSFLVSASNNLYFSMGVNKTFSEYDNANIISPNGKNLYFNMFLDENEGFNFFLNRLDRATQPFLAAYWSGATHYPYKDYGHMIITDDTQSYSRYINNLFLLDQELKKAYDMLTKKNLIDHTIFIVVGDHGELFGQHENLWMHGKSLYQEEIKVPLLIYAPKLFKAQTISQATSSIDILPTLLAAMNISYGNRLQGESFPHNVLARKYVFVYNDQDEIAAIDQHNIKMQISFANNTCITYDLNKDPSERHPFTCNNKNQQEAIVKFRNFQPKILGWYNQVHYFASKS